jgi:hypothetical protein
MHGCKIWNECPRLNAEQDQLGPLGLMSRSNVPLQAQIAVFGGTAADFPTPLTEASNMARLLTLTPGHLAPTPDRQTD